MSSAKATKKSAFSCEPCRRRKVKCGGEQPKCVRCTSRSEECIYKLNPTLSYTQRLERRIQELEDQLAEVNTSPAASYSSMSTPGTGAGETKAPTKRERGAEILMSSPRDQPLQSDRPADSQYLFNIFPPHSNELSSDADQKRRQRLVSNAWQQRALEDLAGIPAPFHYLLNIHWFWIQPIFNTVYRPCFTRDMQTMGPYYSHMLLNAILAHSVRWAMTDAPTKRLLDDAYDGGRVFAKHARSMLFQEINDGTCSITTIQTCILLSGQEIGLGNSMQAWVYSGIAFRVMDHIGLCVEGQYGNTHLTDEDIEIRRRIYWSCYFWDKLVSLYLGYRPAIQETETSPRLIMFDDSSENEMWLPVGLPEEITWNYPPQPSYSASCFLATSRLAIILNQVVLHMYDINTPNSDEEIVACFRTQAPAMKQFWEELPPHLKLDPLNLPELAPPAHILALNCLYHTFKIVLYRPMLTRPPRTQEDKQLLHSCVVECVTSALSCVAIFDLNCKSFGISHTILTLAYSIYIAATVLLLQVQANPLDALAVHRVTYCIRRLDQIKARSAFIATCVDLVMTELSALGVTLSPQSASSNPSPTDGSSSTHQRDIHFDGMPQTMAYEATYGNGDMYIESGVPVSPDFFDALPTLVPLTLRIGQLQSALAKSQAATMPTV